MNSKQQPPAAAPETSDKRRIRAEVLQQAAAFAVVFASLIAFAAVTSPAPGPNEPHYPTKARHFWDPNWCRGDLFLESADVHIVFYETVGAFTNRLTFLQSAWIGRVLAAAILAVGWMAVVSQVLPGVWTSVWSLWAYLLLTAIGNLSGEWMVGGVEGKVFAYGLVFIGLAQGCQRNWIWAAAAFGAAISFHPVVGGWSLICAVFAAAMVALLNRGRAGNDLSTTSASQVPVADSRQFRESTRLCLASIVLVLCALPGLIPAVQLFIEQVPPKVAFDADYIQVFYCLSHHLNPETFGSSAFVMYGLLAAFWLLARRQAGFGNNESLIAWFVVGTMLLALAGLAVGWGAEPPEGFGADGSWMYALRMKFMKLYPFRLVDVMLPVSVGLVLAGMVERWLTPNFVAESKNAEAAPSENPAMRLRSHAHARGLAVWLAFGAAFIASLLIPTPPQRTNQYAPQQVADWEDICRWISSETPPSALFLAPTQGLPFKWYAERPEYVCYKDCPQDARGIVEWNRRLLYLRDWGQSNYVDGYSREAVAKLRHDTGIEYLVASRLGPFEIEPVYHNASYRVYDLTKLRDAKD